jgi:TatD DNase family protein
MPLFDTHAHLDQDDYDADRTAVVERAVAAGVEAILCVGVDRASSEAVLRLAEIFPTVHAAVGIHPNSTAKALPDDWRRVCELADHPKVAALGETGLDRYWDDAPIELQREFFLRHLQLSREKKLPVVIHCRDAWDDLMPLLREDASSSPILGIMHAMSGDAAQVEECVALGLHISFAGNVTYKNKKFEPLRAAAGVVPWDRLLVETDCPYLTPEPLRGKEKRNEPASVRHTAAFLAQLRGVSLQEIEQRTTQNAKRLLGRKSAMSRESSFPRSSVGTQFRDAPASQKG